MKAIRRSSQKVGEIELFRAIFSVIILLRHSEYLTGRAFVFIGGSFAVEFFFIVSGYLMMNSLERKRDVPIENLAQETLQFVRKKALAIYPEIVLSFVIGFLVKCVSVSLSSGQIAELFSGSFFELILVQRTGVGTNSVNSVVWYIQSMLLCMIILYPLIRKYPEMMTRIVLPLGALLLLGWLSQNYNDLRGPGVWTGYTYKGNLRAMAELCLGATCFFAVERIRKIRFSRFARILFCAVKWACWIILILYMVDGRTKYDFFGCVLFCIAIVLSFSRICIDQGIYQNSVVLFLGKFSVPLYFNHVYFAWNLNALLPQRMSDGAKMICYIVCSVAASILVMLLAKRLRSGYPKLKIRLQRLFFARQTTDQFEQA